MSIDRWMDKEVVVHIHNGILFSHKRNAFESFLMRRMNLEPFIKSEMNQKEKDKYCILMTYTESRKWYWRIYLQGSNGETDIENKLMDMGRGEERVRCMESNMETYITICKLDRQWEFAVCLRKLKQGLFVSLGGWDREGDGKEIQKGEDICISMADFMLRFNRKQQNSIQQLPFNKK